MKLLFILLFWGGLMHDSFPQEISGYETIKINGVRVQLRYEKVNDKDSYFILTIQNERLSPIFLDSTYFDISVCDGSKYVQIYGTSYIGTLPIDLVKIKSRNSLSVKLKITEEQIKKGIKGEVNFITRSALKKFYNRNNQEFDKLYKELNTSILDIEATIIKFQGFDNEVEWSGFNWGD